MSRHRSDEAFFVTAGTGKIGTAFVEILASDARRPRVRVATRSPGGARARLLRSMSPETVEPVVFDADSPSSMAAALAGVTRVLIIAPFGGDMAAWHHKVVDAVTQAGTCRHIVKVSVTGARSPGPGSDPPPGRIPLAHWQGEEIVRASGIAATCIRPTIFAQHFLMSPGLYTRGDTRFYLPTGRAPIAFLDCRDIAAAAAALLSLDDDARAPHAGTAFELTGPRGVTAAEIAETLSLVANRAIVHVDGEAAFVARCRELGIGDGVKGIYAEAAGGWFGTVAVDPFPALTGRFPRSFAEFALDHAAVFGGTAGY